MGSARDMKTVLKTQSMVFSIRRDTKLDCTRSFNNNITKKGFQDLSLSLVLVEEGALRDSMVGKDSVEEESENGRLMCCSGITRRISRISAWLFGLRSSWNRCGRNWHAFRVDRGGL